jgi:hypothetical protein
VFVSGGLALCECEELLLESFSRLPAFSRGGDHGVFDTVEDSVRSEL